MTTVSRTFRALAVTICCTASAFLGGAVAIVTATAKHDVTPLHSAENLLGFVAKDYIAFPQAIVCKTYVGAIAFGKILAKFGTNIQASVAHEKYINQSDCFRRDEATFFYTDDLTGTESLSGVGEPRILLVTTTELGVWSLEGYYLLVPLNVMDLVFGPQCNTPAYATKVEVHVFSKSGPCWIDL